MIRRLHQGRRSLDPQQQTLHAIGQRIPHARRLAQQHDVEPFEDWLADIYEDATERGEIYADPEWYRGEVENWLSEQLGLSVRGDGLIEIWQLDPVTRFLIAGLPIVLYHHTASGKKDRVLRQIREQGLVRSPPKRADSRCSGAGVYLTSAVSGRAVSGYKHVARACHGGDTMTLSVVIRDIDQLWPDPDDADISSGHVQWVTDYVPPGDILWDD